MPDTELGIYLHYIILFSAQYCEVGVIIISVLENSKQVE